jgi:hypothetical protein
VQVFTLRKNTVLTEMKISAESAEINSSGFVLAEDDRDYYRADKIPTAGHFIRK